MGQQAQQALLDLQVQRVRKEIQARPGQQARQVQMELMDLLVQPDLRVQTGLTVQQDQPDPQGLIQQLKAQPGQQARQAQQVRGALAAVIPNQLRHPQLRLLATVG